jgi:hypothetical protein
MVRQAHHERLLNDPVIYAANPPNPTTGFQLEFTPYTDTGLE